MLQPVTRKITDESEGVVYRYTFYCDVCGSPKESVPYRSDTALASPEERERESKDAYERANKEAMGWFNRCPVCLRFVCDDCFRVIFDKEPDMCKECLAAEAGKAGRKGKHTHLAAIMLVFMITGAGILHLQRAETDHVYIGENITPLAEFPIYESAYVVNGGADAMISLQNPSDNSATLTFEVALEGTGETLYLSEQFEPGMTAEKFKLNRALETGEHRAVLIVRSYEKGSPEETEAARSALILIVE